MLAIIPYATIGSQAHQALTLSYAQYQDPSNIAMMTSPITLKARTPSLTSSSMLATTIICTEANSDCFCYTGECLYIGPETIELSPSEILTVLTSLGESDSVSSKTTPTIATPTPIPTSTTIRQTSSARTSTEVLLTTFVTTTTAVDVNLASTSTSTSTLVQPTLPVTNDTPHHDKSFRKLSISIPMSIGSALCVLSGLFLWRRYHHSSFSRIWSSCSCGLKPVLETLGQWKLTRQKNRVTRKTSGKKNERAFMTGHGRSARRLAGVNMTEEERVEAIRAQAIQRKKEKQDVGANADGAEKGWEQYWMESTTASASSQIRTSHISKDSGNTLTSDESVSTGILFWDEKG